MKERWYEIIAIIILGVTLAFQSLITYNNTKECTKCEQLTNFGEHIMMYKEVPYSKFNINGVYFSDKNYYCVWTKDRTDNNIMDADPYIQGINRTTVHEFCHYLIDTQYEHFCKD